MEKQKYTVEYYNEDQKHSTRIFKGIKKAETVAWEKKVQGFRSIHIVGFDSAGHRTLEQRVN